MDTIKQRVNGIEKLGPLTAGSYVVRYDSLLDVVRAGSDHCEYGDHERMSRATHRNEWQGTDSYDEAEQLALNGWSEGVGRIVDFSERLSEQVSRRLPAHGMDLWEEGGEIDVASYLDGQRACMWTWAEQDNKRPVVTVTVNVTARSSITTEEYTVGGALVAALVDALESSGKRVELDIMNSVESVGDSWDTTNLTISANVKRPEEALDLGAIAYAVAHPSMLRRTVFAIKERAPREWTRQFKFYKGGGYGSVAEAPKELRGDIHVRLDDIGRLGVKEGYDWLIKNLQEQGVEVSG
jgi:hypothetical protein